MSKKAISDETNVERIERKSKKNMLVGTILGYLAILISVFYGLYLTPKIINAVGSTNYGLYGLATSIATLLLMDFGLSTTINTYLAKLRAAGDKAGVERFLAAIFKLYLTLDLVFIVIIAGVYFATPYIFSNDYSPEQLKVLQTLILMIGGFALISVPCSCFTGVISTYEKFSWIKLVDIIQKALYLGFSILSIHLEWGITGIVAANVGSGIFAVFLRVIYTRTYLNIKLDLRKSVSKKELSSILSFSAWSLVIAIFSRLVISVTPFILGIVSTAIEVSIFSLVITIESYIFMVGEMTSNFFLAKIARADFSGKSEEERLEALHALIIKIGKLQFVVIGLIICGFISVGQEFIGIWLHDVDWAARGGVNIDPNAIQRSIYLCIIMICSYELVHIPQLALQNAMLTHGRIKPLAITAIIKAAVNLSMTFVLSYFYGAIGAAIAILTANIIELVTANIFYRKYLKISLRRYFAKIYIPGMITFCLALGAGLGLHFLPLLNYRMILKLLFNGVVVVIVYLLGTFFILFNKEEKKFYGESILKILHIKRKNKAVPAHNSSENEVDESNSETEQVEEQEVEETKEETEKIEDKETE